MIPLILFNSCRRLKKGKLLTSVLFIAGLPLVYYYSFQKDYFNNELELDGTYTGANWREIVSRYAQDLPMNCTDLFKGLSKKDFFPKQYLRNLKNFKKKLRDVLIDKNVVGIEGHSGQLPQQQYFYWLLANQPNVKTICEIGFNAGHSALVWLSANKNVTLYSFDINQHRYTEPMAEYLKDQFRNRFFAVYGPSLMTVPIVSQIAQFKCDISVIDGAHTKDMAVNDIINMRKLSDGRTLVVIDDTAKDTQGRRNEVSEAVQEVVRRNMIKPIYSCSFQMSSRGFAFFSFNDDYH